MMLQYIPLYVSLVFTGTVIAAVWLLYITIRHHASARYIVAGAVVWLAAQAALSISHVYSNRLNSLPPKIVLLGILPPLLLTLLLFASKKGRHFIDGLPLVTLTYIHTIRIPVELVLYLLFLHGAVPQLMTFEGRNFDIIAGITAPLVGLGMAKAKVGTTLLLLWNMICLGLLINIVINALLAAPTPLQQFGFEQPNIGILYFPFSWLPVFIVPVVLLAHLVSLRQLVRRHNK
jgi:hypothetical protein